MESKLTTLARKRLEKDYELLSRDSIVWFQSRVRGLRNPGSIVSDITKERHRSKSGTVAIGKMYFFEYQPKDAKTLKYYDTFPLVLILEKYPDGFLGINFHYLPVLIRAAFLDQLVNFASKNNDDEIQRLRVSYEILASSRRYRALEPALKRYLYSHMETKPLRVESFEWETAIFLPVEQFQKAQKQMVFKESIKEMKKN